MTSEQEAGIVKDVMEDLKLPETDRGQVIRQVRRTVDRILIYCNREDLPDRLLSTVSQMVSDMLRADGSVKEEKDVASITRGDTSISYRDSSGNRRGTVDFMKNYEHVLNRYRKMNLPKDEKA